jgi:hypothetical protein
MRLKLAIIGAHDFRVPSPDCLAKVRSSKRAVRNL